MPDIKGQTLSAFVSRVIEEKDLSTYEVQRRASGRISQTHVNRIKTGKVPNPSAVKLKALAQGLGVSEEEIFAVVRGKPPDALGLAREQLNNLMTKFERLEPSKKAYAQSLIDLINREFERLSRES